MTNPQQAKTYPSTADLADAYETCRLLTRREARNFYFAFLTLPAQRRRAIYVAYAFCRYCDDSVDEAGTTEDKLARIARLRHLLAETYEGRAAEPVFIGLADVADRYQIPPRVL